jgi:hypothetical protein
MTFYHIMNQILNGSSMPFSAKGKAILSSADVVVLQSVREL